MPQQYYGGSFYVCCITSINVEPIVFSAVAITLNVDAFGHITSISTIDTFIVDVDSSTPQQLTGAKVGTDIILSAVTGDVGVTKQNLVTGESVFKWATENTVASVNGCTGILGITGVSGEIEIINSCPNITVGLPDNVTINNLNITGSLTAILDGGVY